MFRGSDWKLIKTRLNGMVKYVTFSIYYLTGLAYFSFIINKK